jgi:hypothetical protein
MNRSTSLLCLASVIAGLGAPIDVAVAYPALWMERQQLRIPFDNCANAAFGAVQAAGLQSPGEDTEDAGGTTPTARGAIKCVRLPKVGPCGRDGATAVYIAASDKDLDEAKSIVRKMRTGLGDPVLIDCN